MTSEVVHPPPEPPGTGAAKDRERYNKVEGSHGEVTRTHGEVGTRAGTCRSLESWRVWLAGLCDAGCPRCRDPASPRGPAPAAAAAGERVSPRGSLSPRIPPGGSWVPREAGGTGRGQPLSQRPAALCSSRRLSSSSQSGFPRPEARCGARAHGQIGLRGSHYEPHAPMVGPRHSSERLASRFRPKCRVTPGVSRPAPEGGQGHVPRHSPSAHLGENRSPAEE